jgi:hypothetical protein
MGSNFIVAGYPAMRGVSTSVLSLLATTYRLPAA